MDDVAAVLRRSRGGWILLGIGLADEAFLTDHVLPVSSQHSHPSAEHAHRHHGRHLQQEQRGRARKETQRAAHLHHRLMVLQRLLLGQAR